MDIWQLIKTGQWCSFWDDNGDETFRVGYLLGGNELFSMFALVTTHGYDDGLYLTPTSRIFRVDVADRYTERIKKLFFLYEHEERLTIENHSDISNIWFCAQAKERSELVSVYLETGETINGFVVDLTDSILSLARIDEEGREDGLSIIQWESIIKLRRDSGDCRILAQLHEGEL